MLELHPWSGFEEEAQAFSYKLLSLSLNDPSGIYMESTAQLLKMVKKHRTLNFSDITWFQPNGDVSTISFFIIMFCKPFSIFINT